MSEISQTNKDSNSNKDQKVSQFSEIVTKLIDKLVDKDVSITYTFDHLEIDVPSAHGPGGKELGGAKWVIDGKITIATTSTSTSTSSHSSESPGSSSKYLSA